MSDIKVKTSTNQILVRVADQNAIKVLSATNGVSLSNLTDIDLSAISDKSILRYNATSGKWETLVNLDIWYVDNITIDGNSILSSNINGNIVLDPNGTGKVSIPDDTYLSFGNDFDSLIRYNESSSDKLEVSGSDWNFLNGVSVSISDTTASVSKSTGALTISGGVGIGSDLYIGGNLNLDGEFSILGGLTLTGDYISIGSTVGITTINSVKTIFNSTNSIRLPVGNTSQRDASPTSGSIRYNTQLSSFEGYGPGNSWISLGGVRDVDGNTYIIPETSPGANENTLYFYADGYNSATLTNSLFRINTNVNVSGSSSIAGNLHVSGTSEFVGVVTFRGGTINLGDSDTDDVVVGGDFASSLFPTTDNVYSIGSTSKMWRNIYLREKVVSGSLFLDFPTSGIHTRGVSYFNSDGKLISTNEPEIGYGSTSNYVLTTNESNVPVWTDAIDGGSY